MLVCISPKSKLHWIFRSLLDGKYKLCVTTDILAEYAEIVERHMGATSGESIMGVLENLPNIEFVTAYFKFGLLKDPDDNKFVDCAISANANYIVSHDADFRVLKQIDFPRVNVIDTDAFRVQLEIDS